MSWIEIIGYVGSGLVLVSMLMRSVVRLRVINLAGSVIFTVYALLIRSYPTAVMNFCLAGINIFYLIRLSRPVRHFSVYEDRPGSAWVSWLLTRYRDDIALHFPDFRAEAVQADARVFVVLQESEAAGILIGIPDGDGLTVSLDYSTPVYRDCSVGTALYAALPEHGIRHLDIHDMPEKHIAYLHRMGFESQPDGFMRKTL